jgi:two-component sensor histidine kinase
MPDGGRARPRILYVDDDVGLCRLVSRGLERRGYDVVTVNDGAAGVEAAARESFDAIAIDHYMPGQTGLAALEQIRATGPEPPIVYVTGSDEIAVAIAALKAGASDYVLKSGSDDFLHLLSSALEQALEQVALRAGKAAAEQALLAANTRLEEIVSRQAALLREVNHRVANSLQLVSSLVHMQAQAVGDGPARAALLDTQTRIAAIMQIHRRLYTSDDVERVDVADYLEGLAVELSATGGNRPVRLDAERIQLNTDKAVSLGVVVAELVTNAMKYAYAPDQAGEVRVGLKRLEPGRLRLEVEDDGPGLPADGAAKGTGLGQKVIAAMARSLGSKVEFDTAHRGARAVLDFQG